MSDSIPSTAGKQNLPGWSLARDTPREPKKQGWQCPVPTVQDWEDYKNWKQEQEKKEELPAAPQVFLADTTLLFYQDPDVQLPWIHRLKCELPRRVGRLSGELPVKASYIGFGKEDDLESYEVFKRAMAQIGVVLCRHIHHPPSRFEIAHLEQSDLILVDGGNRKQLWQTLSSDVGTSAVAEHVKWRYLQGAVVIAVGEAMSLLGEKSWYEYGKDNDVMPFTGWKIFPHVVAPEADNVDLEDLVQKLGGAGVIVLGIHSGCGMIFNRDGLVEPLRGMMQEYRWDWQTESVKQALLLGPPRSTGLICPLYAAMKRQEGDPDDADGSEDVFSYALTQEEEKEEEELIEHFDIHSSWLTIEARNEVEAAKKLGNDAFKAGKADLANLKYEQAQVLIGSNGARWSQLDEESKKTLDALESPKKEQELDSLGRKEDYRATALLTPLLLNRCACYLLAHEQDEKRKTAQGQGQATAAAATGEAPAPTAASSPSGTADGAPPDVALGDSEGQTTALMAVRDNLVAAFRAANEALLLSGGRSAKAWYRRGTVFERMRDPRNAERDFEEALVRAPGDKAIMKKRNEVRELAGQVAETTYYARHKELDAQEERLELKTRRALLLQGSFGDPFKDEKGQFALAQPLARLVEGTLKEVDGRPRLVLSSMPGKAVTEAPYLHPHALWTWEFLVPRAAGLQLLQIEEVDLGSGPLEWLCKGLRTHAEVRTLRLVGVHLGAAGAKMLRSVLAQNTSLVEVALDACALHDAGLYELAKGLQDHAGALEALSLKRNSFTSRRLGALADAFCADGVGHSLMELDLSWNPLTAAGAKEIGRIIGSDAHKLRTMRLQGCLLDLSAFWRLVSNLNDSRPLTQLDLRTNPLGRGTRRCWRSQMGPTVRCEVLLSDHPRRVLADFQKNDEEMDVSGYPLPSRWI
uniref:Uncharacterized protein n=1 Tax=Alexandrium monilatum TaxID=311494 RepID=A0A7S4W5M4_9DINO